MQNRRYQILRRIIEEFINSAKPISSGSFAKSKEFNVSSATIRSEMSQLEKEGLLVQPHTSAGRVPTKKGYEHFVKSLMNISPGEKKSLFDEFQSAKKQYFLKKAREKVYDSIAILSRLTENVAFATIPENKSTIYMGIANFLKQPEFAHDSSTASGVIEVLEEGFFEKIAKIKITDKVDIHIGESNIFPNFESCAFMCSQYTHLSFSGILGIVGPIRMNYPRNKTLIEYTKIFIEGPKLLN